MATTTARKPSAFARRVSIYALALTERQEPNAFGVTPAEAAAYLLDHLDYGEQRRVQDALRAVGEVL